MADPKLFSDAEIAAAQSMRSRGASWRAVGREIGCHEDTIRCALDDEYRQRRHAEIAARRVEARRGQRIIAEAVAEANARRLGNAYKPSALGQDAFHGRVAVKVANVGGRARPHLFQ